MVKKDKLKNILDEAIKGGATHIVSNEATFNKLKAEGIPVEERFITYEDYFQKLIEEKSKHALDLLKQLPLLDKTIANSVITSIYEEIRSSFGLGIFTSTIFNSILLLEFAMRDKLFQERLKRDPNSKWEQIEKLKMRSLANQLSRIGIISDKEKGVLNDFNDNLRNPYLHINIHKMIQGIYANNVKKVDVNTQTLTVENNMDISKFRHLWFLAKNYYDKTYVMHVLAFCVYWTNRLLKTS